MIYFRNLCGRKNLQLVHIFKCRITLQMSSKIYSKNISHVLFSSKRFWCARMIPFRGLPPFLLCAKQAADKGKTLAGLDQRSKTWKLQCFFSFFNGLRNCGLNKKLKTLTNGFWSCRREVCEHPVNGKLRVIHILDVFICRIITVVVTCGNIIWETRCIYF